MKRSLLFLLLLPIGIPALGAPIAPRAPLCAPRRHSVLEFYNLLPSRYFLGDNRRVMLTKDRAPIVDIAHDFLLASGEAGQPGLQVAVFRFQGTETVGVAAAYEMFGELNFYRLQNGRLHDVTRQVLPRPFGRNQIAELPRIGTTVRILNENPDTLDDKPAYRLEWRGGRFVVSQ